MSESNPMPPPIDYGSGPEFIPIGNQADAPKQVGFVEAVSRAFRQYAKFSGRASRSEYWWFSLFLFLTQLGFGLLVGVAQSKAEALAQMAGVVLAVFPIVVLIPALALTSRRIHDTGRSAKLYFGLIIGLMVLSPVLYVLFFIAVLMASGGGSQGVLFIALAIVGSLFVYQLVITLSPGTPGANTYGPGLESIPSDLN